MNLLAKPPISDRSTTAVASNGLVNVSGLTKQFGTFTALDHVSLSIGRGEVFGLLGPNGAGKSTLIRTLMGFLRPDSGSASIAGLDCYRDRVAVHNLTTYLPGDARLFGLMKGTSVLRQFASYRANANLDRALAIADRMELDLNRWVGLMSTGMRQKLAIAVCMAVDCPLIILDEPTANLDPTVRARVLKMVAEAKVAGKTVIFSSHVLSEIEEVCDHVAILRKGHVVFESSMAQLNQQHRIEFHCEGNLPPLPENLRDKMTLETIGKRHRIETPDRLADVLRWLSSVTLDEVRIEPVGLQSAYDRYHQ